MYIFIQYKKNITVDIQHLENYACKIKTHFSI